MDISTLLIWLAIPAFLVGIVAEFVYLKRHGKSYDYRDSATSIASGLGYQLLNIPWALARTRDLRVALFARSMAHRGVGGLGDRTHRRRLRLLLLSPGAPRDSGVLVGPRRSPFERELQPHDRVAHALDSCDGHAVPRTFGPVRYRRQRSSPPPTGSISCTSSASTPKSSTDSGHQSNSYSIRPATTACTTARTTSTSTVTMVAC